MVKSHMLYACGSDPEDSEILMWEGGGLATAFSYRHKPYSGFRCQHKEFICGSRWEGRICGGRHW